MEGSIHIGSAIFPSLASLIATLLMWPAVFVSFVLIAAGLLSERPALVWAGALLGLPFFAYLALTPRFRGVGLIPVVLHLTAALLLAKGRPRVAAALCLPGVLLAGFVLSAVMRQ
jgi:hypothetical protein